MTRTIVGLVSSISLLLVVLAVSLYLQPWKVSQAASPSLARHISVMRISGLVSMQGMIINDNISFSRNNVWVAGTYSPNNPPCVTHCYNLSGAQLFLEHFNGSQWNAFTFPLDFATDTVEDMSAASANDIYVVGIRGSNNTLTYIMEYWNGRQWSSVSLAPPPNSIAVRLHAVIALSSHDVWTVGECYNYITSTNSALIEHFDGKKWSFIPSPTSVTSLTKLERAGSSNTVIATGVGNGSTQIFELSAY